jgi:hypothetical protein
MSKKLLFFDRYNVEEYYLYDPEANLLDIWLRTTDGLEPIFSNEDWVSPRLNVRFDISTGRLQLYRPDGTKCQSYIEVNQRLSEAEALLQKYRDRFGDLPTEG